MSQHGTYLPDDDLAAAAEVALTLKMPLLLTGEPGTGKSTFAEYVAEHLAPKFYGWAGTFFPLYKFETKSTSVATDLFYRFDSLGRFHAVHDKEMSNNPLDYITFEALGRAILESLPLPQVSSLVRQPDKHDSPRRSVVLIDEVDKAPRDFPNDLLNEIEHMRFRIPELSRGGAQGAPFVQADQDYWPIVILTSNSEKNLPAPFLRRCVFHHIKFPESSRLEEIVNANITGGSGALVKSAIEFFYDIREQLQLEKLPTTSELINWVNALRALPPDAAGSSLAKVDPKRLKATLSALGKTTNDLAQIEELASTLGVDAVEA